MALSGSFRCSSHLKIFNEHLLFRADGTEWMSTISLNNSFSSGSFNYCINSVVHWRSTLPRSKLGSEDAKQPSGACAAEAQGSLPPAPWADMPWFLITPLLSWAPLFSNNKKQRATSMISVADVLKIIKPCDVCGQGVIWENTQGRDLGDHHHWTLCGSHRKPTLSALLWLEHGGMWPSSVCALEMMFSPTWWCCKFVTPHRRSTWGTAFGSAWDWFCGNPRESL